MQRRVRRTFNALPGRSSNATRHPLASARNNVRHAYGNDFLYVESADVRGAALDVLAREMCDRHTGIGADGLIVYERVDGDAAMRLFNADGSRAEVSGNGVRALGALLLEKETDGTAELTVRTEGGVKHLTRIGLDGSRQTFRASMGAPADVRQITLTASESRQPSR